MTRTVTTVQIVNNSTSVPPLYLNLDKTAPVYRVALNAGQLALVGAGGAGGYTYSATGLPAGLSLDTATGAITGTPTTIGHNIITATVTDSATNTFTTTFTIDVVEHIAFADQNPLPGGKFEVGVPISYQYTVSGQPTGTVSYALAAFPDNVLPAGVTLSSGGLLSGTPTGTGGPNTFAVVATDSGSGDSVTSNVVGWVTINALSINMITGAYGVVGQTSTCSVDVGAGTGVSPFSFSVEAPSVIDGVTVTPVAPQSGAITSASYDVSCSIAVNSAAAFTVRCVDAMGAVSTVAMQVVFTLANAAVQPQLASTNVGPQGASVQNYTGSGASVLTNDGTTMTLGITPYAVASGTNTYTATIAPVPTAYNADTTYLVNFTNANTGAATLNLNGLGAIAIQLNGAALTSGQIPANSNLTLLYDGTQFQIVGSSPNPNGRFLGATMLTSASGTFTTSASTNTIVIRGVGGGGGAGGVAGVASSAAASGGGGAGSPAYQVFSVSPSTGYSYTCGAGGSGGSAGANNGTAGSNSTFVVGATTVTAKGGSPSNGVTATASAAVNAGGVGGAAATNDLLGSTGNRGVNGIVISITVVSPGTGADSIFGAGGSPVTGFNGGNAVSYGAGGGGTATTSTSSYPGGSGKQGCWIVEEYS